MVRTQQYTSPIRFDTSRIIGYSTAITLHALALGLLLIPLSQTPVRSDTTREPRWQIPEAKPIVPPPLPTVVPVARTAPPARQPALLVLTETAPVPVFATEAVMTLPVDVGPVVDTPTVTDSIGPATSLQEGVQLRYLRAPAPPYPRDALIAGAQGSVTLRVLVDMDGSPLEVSIERSSGNRSLDNAARTQVLRKWKFQPATDNGHPVQAWGLIPVDFKLG